MKQTFFIIAMLAVTLTGYCQAPAYSNNTYSGRSYPLSGFRYYDGTNYDTVGWYVQSIKPITIYTYAGTPLNHISAPPNSMCVDVTDTSWFIKVVGTDSAGWFKAR
jgi:hypothetical protein